MFTNTIINKGQVGLVFKKGNFDRAISEGQHTIWGGEVKTYNLYEPFTPPMELDILLENNNLKQKLEVITVGDNEVVLYFEDGLFKKVLEPGRYAYWKGYRNRTFARYDITGYEIPGDFDRNLLEHPLMQKVTRKLSIEPTENALFFVDNNFTKVLGPGNYYFWKNAISITISRVDLRQQQMDIPGQEILTKDKANIRMNFLCQYRVADLQKAALGVKDYKEQLYTLLQLALREYTGNYTLDELLANKEEIGPFVLEKVKQPAAEIGIEVMAAGLKDIILPGDIKEIMNQVLVAEKRAQANIITRREETASTRSLLNTAKLMEENSILYKLKELEYVERLSEKITQINISGGGHILEQLKDIFLAGRSSKDN